MKSILGIDIGTSYIKFSHVEISSGNSINWRKISPTFRADANFDNDYAPSLWSIILRNIESTLDSENSNQGIVSGVSIVGISPVLVAFSLKNDSSVTAIPYWLIPEIDADHTGIDKTKSRVEYLKSITSNFCREACIITDLIGYINYKLTGELTLNSITAGELGFGKKITYVGSLDFSHNSSCQLKLVSPAEICGKGKQSIFGKKSEIVVFGGASDSFGTAIASGTSSKGMKMIYLGTFGSLLEVTDSFEALLCSHVPEPCHPYVWKLSVPKFGKTIENFALDNFPSSSLNKSFLQLESIAETTSLRKEELFFAVPIWDQIGRLKGRYHFVGKKSISHYSLGQKSRALLESLAYLILSMDMNKDLLDKKINVAGGGTISDIWLSILCDFTAVP